MTFKEISRRMLKNNYKRYLQYFYCNVFTIALLCTFISIFTNADFMNPHIVNPMISSNIEAPTIFTVIFMFLFIPYSYSEFFRKRKSEYGILITLGMTEREALLNMLSENITVSFFSLLAGMAAGTLLSLSFFAIIRYGIGVNTVSWTLNLKSYAITAGIFIVITVVTLAVQLLGFVKTQIRILIKSKERGEREVKSSLLFSVLGTVLGVISIVLMLCLYKIEPSTVLLISFALSIISAWFLIGCSSYVLRKRGVTNVGKAFILEHFRSYRTVTFIASCLIGIGVFLTGLSIVTYPNMLSNAKNYSPYDLLYVQAGGKNEMTTGEASKLLSKYGVSVTSSTEIPFMRNGAFNLFPVSEINRLSGSNYTVNPGEYLVIYQYDMRDGYEHEMNMSSTVNFDLNSGTLLLKYAGQDIKILLNGNSFAEYTLLLNDADYKTMEEKEVGFIPGVVKCFAFSSWKDSGEGLEALQKALTAQNHCVDDDQERYFRISSKLEEFRIGQQSSQFLIFVIAFVSLLFFISSDIIIYFKIKGEAEDEAVMYRGLYRIGISANETHVILERKNKIYFMQPLLYGVAAGVFFCFAVSSENGYGLAGVAFSAAVSVLLLTIQHFLLKYITGDEQKQLGV